MDRLVLHRVSLPLLAPFGAAHGVTTVRDVVLVAACGHDGTVGWGECPTMSTGGYVGGTTDEAWDWLTGGGALALAKLHLGRVGAADGAPPGAVPKMASGAVLDAVADLDLRSPGQAGAPGNVPEEVSEVAHTAVVGRCATIDDLVEAVGRDVGTGAGHVKLKISPGWDREPLAAVRSTWPTVDLAADANGSYGIEDLPLLASFARLSLRYIEQPLAPATWVRFADRWPVDGPPVALDESILSGADARELALRGNLTFANIKPSRLGGCRRARPVAEALEMLGVRVFVGGMLETGVGRATALRFAAALGNDMPSDLGPSSRYFVDDITEPIVWSRPGFVAVPAGPGIGRTPDPDRLAAATTTSATIEL